MTDDEMAKNDLELIQESLDGMEEGYEEVSQELRQAMNTGTPNNGGFTVI